MEASFSWMTLGGWTCELRAMWRTEDWRGVGGTDVCGVMTDFDDESRFHAGFWSWPWVTHWAAHGHHGERMKNIAGRTIHAKRDLAGGREMDVASLPYEPAMKFRLALERAAATGCAHSALLFP